MIHIFDVDQTVIKHNCAWYFLREALGAGYIRFSQVYMLFFDWLKYKFGKPNIDFIENSIKRLTGIEKSALEQTAEICFQKKIKPNIYAGAAELIKNALSRGEKVIFATSSFDFMIRPLENFFGINNSVSSKLEFIENKTTGLIIEESCFGLKKKTIVEKWLKSNGYNAESACFYSDSYTDIPLLEFCGKAIAVNPDRFLIKEAKKRGWEIIYFHKTLK